MTEPVLGSASLRLTGLRRAGIFGRRGAGSAWPPPHAAGDAASRRGATARCCATALQEDFTAAVVACFLNLPLSLAAQLACRSSLRSRRPQETGAACAAGRGRGRAAGRGGCRHLAPAVAVFLNLAFSLAHLLLTVHNKCRWRNRTAPPPQPPPIGAEHHWAGRRPASAAGAGSGPPAMPWSA